MESAWFRTDNVSGSSTSCAACSAISLDDSWSSGFSTELAVPVALLTVLVRIVWLAERLLTTNQLTPSSKTRLAPITPIRSNRRRERLLSLDTEVIFSTLGASSDLKVFFKILNLLIMHSGGVRVFGF